MCLFLTAVMMNVSVCVYLTAVMRNVSVTLSLHVSVSYRRHDECLCMCVSYRRHEKCLCNPVVTRVCYLPPSLQISLLHLLPSQHSLHVVVDRRVTSRYVAFTLRLRPTMGSSGHICVDSSSHLHRITCRFLRTAHSHICVDSSSHSHRITCRFLRTAHSQGHSLTLTGCFSQTRMYRYSTSQSVGFPQALTSCFSQCMRFIRTHHTFLDLCDIHTRARTHTGTHTHHTHTLTPPPTHTP